MNTNNLSGKLINQFAEEHKSDIPFCWGEKYYPPGGWHEKERKADGTFWSKKFKDIAKLIKDTEAIVQIEPDYIYLTYADGESSIKRNILVDEFLIPLIQ